MVVVDYMDMKVCGWVGLVDIIDDSCFGYIDMVLVVCLLGLVLKFFIYVMVMDEGLIYLVLLLQDVLWCFSDYCFGNFDSGFYGLVSVSEVLVWLLNLLVVQVFEVYGLKCFVVNLCNVGLFLMLFVGVELNLLLIFGGVGVWLEDIVVVYSVFVCYGKVVWLCLKLSDLLIECVLMLFGVVWIVWCILVGEV